MKTLLVTLTLFLFFSAPIQAQQADPADSDETTVTDPSEEATLDETVTEKNDESLAPDALESSDGTATFDTETFRHPRRDLRPHRPPRYPPPGRHPRPPPHYPHPPHYYYDIDYVDCDSHGYRFARCYVGGYIRNAGVDYQRSRSSCIYGYSWGIDRAGLWVDNGCRARFWIERY